MKVITFYSYKGGQGRTMTLACISSLLYRLGKNVVILDLDFEAPGILSKFGRSVFTDSELKEKGVLKYFSKFKKEREFPEDIEPFSVKIAQKEINGNQSQLRIIPTGYAGPDGDYWNTIYSSDWSNLFYPRSEFNRNFFKEMKHAIGRMEPEPDYLLVDAKAGVSEFGSISMIMWADTVICFFSNDLESQEGMKHVLKGLDNISDMRYNLGLTEPKSLKILPVLSRIPHYLTNEKRAEIKEEIFANFLTNKEERRFNKIFMLHSDWDMEIEPLLRIPLEGEIKNIQLVNEYLDLFIETYPEIADGIGSKTKLWEALKISGKPGEIDETYRVFRLYNSQGIMINLSDDQRNVSFKVDTFCAILNDIHKGLIEKNKESDKNLVEIERSFYDAGILAGKNFGESLINKVWDNPNGMSVEDKLDSWCHFDSDVGFGFIERKDLKKDEVGDVLSGTIVVKDNFLADNRKMDEANLCSLLAGYIAGVLGQILGFKVEVSHERSLCMRLTNGRESCDFCFTKE